MKRDVLYLTIIAILAYRVFQDKSISKDLLTKTYRTSPSSNFRTQDHNFSCPELDPKPQAITSVDLEQGSEGTPASPGSTWFWVSLGVSFVLTLFAGAMSGLTVGYLSIDELQLELKLTNGTEEEQKDAKIIIPILAKHHLLLCTLLLANAFAMEALPIFLDNIMPTYAAIIVSTSAVVVVGEIIPQALCTGPKQIKIARTMAPLIKLIMCLLFPICYPISIILDKVLGTHQKTRFVKKDLKTLISLHEENAIRIPDDNELYDEEAHLSMDEVRVINSTIDLRDTPVTKEMEAIDKVFMISDTEAINKELLKKISRAGYSKVPVFKHRDRNRVIGFIRVKTFLEYERYEGKSLEESGICLKPPLIVAKDTSMLEMLMLFQQKRTGIALISDDTVRDKETDAFTYSKNIQLTDQSTIKLIGLISLKDIFEEILESKMMDEDVHYHLPHLPHYRSGGGRFRKGIEEEGYVPSPGRYYVPSPGRQEVMRRSPRSSRWQRKEETTPEINLKKHLLDPSNE